MASRWCGNPSLSWQAESAWLRSTSCCRDDDEPQAVQILALRAQPDFWRRVRPELRIVPPTAKQVEAVARALRVRCKGVEIRDHEPRTLAVVAVQPIRVAAGAGLEGDSKSFATRFRSEPSLPQVVVPTNALASAIRQQVARVADQELRLRRVRPFGYGRPEFARRGSRSSGQITDSLAEACSRIQ